MSEIIDLTSDDGSSPNLPTLNDSNVSDEEDEDLKLAIALSLQDQTDIEEASKAAIISENAPQEIPERTKPSSSHTGLLGLDRKAMEAERLARLKRKRASDADTQKPVQSTSDLSNTTARISPPPPRRQKPNPTQPTTTSKSTPILSTHSTTTTNSRPSFPTPQILLTSQPSRRHPTNPNRYASISLPDILLPPSPKLTLKSTLLSSFIADLDWLFPHFNTRTTTFLLLLHAQTAQHRALLESDFAGLPNVKLVVPEVMGGSGNMHSKVMVLFYQGQVDPTTDMSTGKGRDTGKSAESDEICRIVIPSANLTRADWGVGGIMENILFVVDLPLKSSTGDQEIYSFEKKLKMQLEGMSVPDGVLRKLGRFDFAATKDMEFVHSRSGSDVLETGKTTKTTKTTKAGGDSFFQKQGKQSCDSQTVGDSVDPTVDAKPATDDPARTGLLSLHDAVVSLGLQVPVTEFDSLPQVDFITSSLGNLTSQFVTQLYLAICGQLDPATTALAPKRLNTNNKAADADTALDKVIMQNLKIYFPTSETVNRSKGGPGAGGTICFQSKWWDSNELIRKCLHDCVGVRKDGILMHSKILYVRFGKPKAVLDSQGRDKLYAGWAYVGSANLSESAWGRVVSDAKSRQPKLTCRNWESGVLVPVEVTNAMTDVGALDIRYEGGIESHLGKQDTHEESSLLKDVTAKHGSKVGVCNFPTSAREVTMQVKAGKDDNATKAREMDEDAFDENTMQSSMGATKSPKNASRGRELLTGCLGIVFSEVVPVPIQYPAPGHVARQQKPWFFMG